MALVLSLRVGHDFYVDNKRVVVAWIDSPYRFGIKKDNGVVITLTEDQWQQVFDGVRMQAGIPRNPDSASLVRVVIDAPGIDVVRGDLYRKKGSQSCSTCQGTKVLKDRVPCQSCSGFGCSKCGGSGFVASDFKCPDCAR